MKSVGIREFRDKAHHLTSKEPGGETARQARTYIPVKESEDEEVRRAIDRLSTVEGVIAQSGWDEETLSRA